VLPKFWRGEETTDVSCARSKRQALFDHVLLVLFSHLGLPHLEQLDHPTRIEIDHEADAAAKLSQMLNSQPQDDAVRLGQAIAIQRPAEKNSPGRVSLKAS